MVIQQTQRQLDQASSKLVGQYFSSVKRGFLQMRQSETDLHHQQCLYIQSGNLNSSNLFSSCLEQAGGIITASPCSLQMKYCRHSLDFSLIKLLSANPQALQRSHMLCLDPRYTEELSERRVVNPN